MAKETTFVYEGLDRSGKKRSGEISGSSMAIVKAQLRNQGVAQVSKIKPKGMELNLNLGGGIGSEDISIFTRQMSTMMKAGVPLVRSFEIVEDGLENAEMKKVVNSIKGDVSAGGSFADSLRKHPKYFDDLFCSLVEAGEQSGALETMLERIALYKEKSEGVKKKVKAAMKYPMVVVIIAAIITVIMLLKVVPAFETMFANFGGSLPLPTQMVVNASEWLQSNFVLLIGMIIAAFFGVKTLFAKSEYARHKFQLASLKFPVFGGILTMSAIARFARTLATTFQAGVPLVEALDSAASASGNIKYETALRAIKVEVSSGTELNVAMKNSDIFPAMLLQMVAIGEQSGSVDSMLQKAAEIYEEEVDTMVEGLTAMMEPMIMGFLGIFVGGLVIAMYLPIFSMASSI